MLARLGWKQRLLICLPSPTIARERRQSGSVQKAIIDLLKRPGGTTSKELQKISGWQAHSIRGFLSGTVSKKMRLTVKSVRGEDGEHTNSVKV